MKQKITDGQIVEYLRSYGPSSRASIAHALGVTQQGVAVRLLRMCAAGVLTEDGRGVRGSPVLYQVA